MCWCSRGTAGRDAEGAFATCHCLSLPPSEPGYYFWRDRDTGRITRRSEWFVTKSPTVTIGPRQVKYLISFALPRFCDQSLDRSRKERFYPGVERAVDGEARHRRFTSSITSTPSRTASAGSSAATAPTRPTATATSSSSEVADMVHGLSDTRPDPGCYDFLRHDFDALERDPRRRLSARVPHVSVVSAALHRDARRAAAVRRRSATGRGRADHGGAAAAALHRRRPPHPPVHARDRVPKRIPACQGPSSEAA